MNQPFKIRASMLPGHVDCSRKAIAKQYPRLLGEHGFELRKLDPSIGAAVGTAVHEAAAALLSAKVSDRDYGVADALQDAGVAFRKEIDSGCIWDDTTPNLQSATKQIESLTRAYLPVIEAADPVLVEQQFAARINDDWQLTGKIDLFESDGHLDDLKTGKVERPYIQQAGAYTLLLEANRHKVTSVGTTYIKRVKAGKEQSIPVKHAFDLNSARRSAWAAIQEIRRDVEAFAETGDPWTIRANPMSMMCSEKYCPAWGTDFCTVHLGAHND